MRIVRSYSSQGWVRLQFSMANTLMAVQQARTLYTTVKA